MPEINMEMHMKQEAENKIRSFQELNRFVVPGQIVMAGFSLMEQFPINELMMSAGISGIVYNRGIGGYTTAQYMSVLDTCVLDLKPRKLFINIGTNDIGATENWQETLIRNYREILQRIRSELPECQIYVLAFYPVANMEKPFMPPNAFEPRTLDKVQRANELVKAMAEQMDIPFLNVNQAVEDDDGFMRMEFAKDPVHMWPHAYAEILKELKPYLN